MEGLNYWITQLVTEVYYKPQWNEIAMPSILLQLHDFLSYISWVSYHLYVLLLPNPYSKTFVPE